MLTVYVYSKQIFVVWIIYKMSIRYIFIGDFLFLLLNWNRSFTFFSPSCFSIFSKLRNKNFSHLLGIENMRIYRKIGQKKFSFSRGLYGDTFNYVKWNEKESHLRKFWENKNKFHPWNEIDEKLYFVSVCSNGKLL